MTEPYGLEEGRLVDGWGRPIEYDCVVDEGERIIFNLISQGPKADDDSDDLIIPVPDRDWRAETHTSGVSFEFEVVTLPGGDIPADAWVSIVFPVVDVGTGEDQVRWITRRYEDAVRVSPPSRDEDGRLRWVGYFKVEDLPLTVPCGNRAMLTWRDANGNGQCDAEEILARNNFLVSVDINYGEVAVTPDRAVFLPLY